VVEVAGWAIDPLVQKTKQDLIESEKEAPKAPVPPKPPMAPKK
jgi:hypothetical protein